MMSHRRIAMITVTSHFSNFIVVNILFLQKGKEDFQKFKNVFFSGPSKSVKFEERISILFSNLPYFLILHFFFLYISQDDLVQFCVKRAETRADWKPKITHGSFFL